MGLNRVAKPKNQRVKRALEKRAPKVHENDKSAVFIRGGHTSETITQVLNEMSVLKKPLSVMYKRKKKKISRPFEDQSELEFMANKTDSSLFMFGSNSKKRPNNIVIGRLFDGHVLDMFEFGVEKFVSMRQFAGPKPCLGSKPCIVFSGEAFDGDAEYKRLKNLFIDFFRGPKAEQVHLQGLEHVYHISAVDGKILLRSHRILLKKSGSRVPRVELEEIGPSIDFVIRRTKLASDDLYKTAKRQPENAKIKKKKNISRDGFGSQLGRVHMEKMDLSKLQTRKMKGLKQKSFTAAASDENQEVENEPEVDQTPPTKKQKSDDNTPSKKKQNSDDQTPSKKKQKSDDQVPSKKKRKVAAQHDVDD